MKFVRREDVQLGRAGILSGVWPNIWAGALDVELWGCPNCRKLDFYWSGSDEEAPEDWDGGEVLLLDTAGRCAGVSARLAAAEETLAAEGIPARRAEALLRQPRL